MNVVIAQRLDDLIPHAKAWNELSVTCQASGALAMQSYAWVSSFLAHRVEQDCSWCVFFVFEGDELIGVLPVLGVNNRHLASPRDEHTFGINFLLRLGYERDAVKAILKALPKSFPSWHVLMLARVVRNSNNLAVFERGGHLGWTTITPYSRGGYIPVGNSYADIKAGLSKNFKSNLNKARNKLNKLADVRYEWHVDNNFNKTYFEQFLALEVSGWKGREGTAIANDDNRKAFYATLCQRLAEAGWLEWHFLIANDTLLAGHLAVRHGGSLLIWKLGYNESYSKCSPGSLLLDQLLVRACEDSSISEINLSTNQPWYANWNMQWREFVCVRIHATKLQPILMSYLPRRLKTFILQAKRKAN